MDTKTKVLFFIESLSGGGAEKILFTIVNHINKDRFDLTVSTVIAEGVYAERVSKLTRFKPLIKVRNPFLFKVLYHLIYFYLPIKWVYSLFVPKGNDVEVAFCEGFATKLLSHSSAKRKIAWVHTDMILNPWTQGLVYSSIENERNAYLKYNKVICVSETVRDSVKNKFAVESDVLYNPIYSDEIIKKSKEKIPVPEKKRFRFITLGRLVEQKGYDRLLKVVKKLRNENFDFDLWILGEGPARKALTDYIIENGLEKEVKIWGFIPNPYPYMVTGDVFVCSSRSEGYSTAVSEALILGIPVVTTLCSGMKELLQDGNSGLIVKNEELTLVEPLKKMMNDPDYLTYLSHKAKERGSDFTISSLMKPIEELLQ